MLEVERTTKIKNKHSGEEFKGKCEFVAGIKKRRNQGEEGNFKSDRRRESLRKAKVDGMSSVEGRRMTSKEESAR